MCGICGILDFKGRTGDPALIRGMMKSMAHRGPDAANSYTGEGVDLGHLRLSIIDLSEAANQPFSDHSGRYRMVFNGEIYNYQDVKKLITDYPFSTSSDTEMILAAFIKWGPGCLQYFRGMFAFAIWDRQEKEIFLARDRMGVKPLYYFLNEDHLIFSSEVRAILATGLLEKKVNKAALLDYFSFQSVTYPHSLIEGILQLEAGTWMRIKNRHLEKKVYWDVTNAPPAMDPSDTASIMKDPGAVRKKIRELMLQSVERRLVADVPVGTFLSGGIDSSAVVGLMAEAGKGRPNTFNISFEEKEYDESVYAELIAKKFNTNHTRLLLKPTDFLGELGHALDAMDTPSGDGINTYVVSKAIRQQGMTVALSGVGGDELFAGYPFFNQYLQIRSKDWLWQFPGGLRRLAGAVLSPGGEKGKKGRIAQILGAASPAIEETYPIFRQILSPGLLRELTSLEDGSDRVTTTSMQEELRLKKANIDRLPLLSQVSAAEYLGYTQHTLLKDTDQMGMAPSLEIREPFFDQDLVEFVLAIPDSIKKPTYPKSLLVESLKPLLPHEIVHRKKQGFLFPWEIWLKNDLRTFCEAHIQKMSKRSFIKGDALLAYWKEFLAGDKHTRWSEIWLFVVLDYWLEKNDVNT